MQEGSLSRVFGGSDDPVATFLDVLRDIASTCIPQTLTVPRRLGRPWFTDSCREDIQERKRAFRLGLDLQSRESS